MIAPLFCVWNTFEVAVKLLHVFGHRSVAHPRAAMTSEETWLAIPRRAAGRCMKRSRFVRICGQRLGRWLRQGLIHREIPVLWVYDERCSQARTDFVLALIDSSSTPWNPEVPALL
jgi:hypothetical protein